MAEIIEAMRVTGRKEPDPQEVAGPIYRCATEDITIHNVAGVGAEHLVEMLASIPRQQVLQRLTSRLPGLEDWVPTSPPVASSLTTSVGPQRPVLGQGAFYLVRDRSLRLLPGPRQATHLRWRF